MEFPEGVTEAVGKSVHAIQVTMEELRSSVIKAITIISRQIVRNFRSRIQWVAVA